MDNAIQNRDKLGGKQFGMNPSLFRKCSRCSTYWFKSIVQGFPLGTNK